MSVNYYNKDTGELVPISGGLLFADTPVGTIQAYGSNTAPSGWLLCQGQAVSRTTYAELFEVIGTAFGAGDLTTTFNVPDLREATTKGVGLSGKSENHYSENGVVLGEFIEDRLQSHTHGIRNGFDGADPDSAERGDGRHGYSAKSNDASGRTGNTTEVKAIGVNYIIKAKQIGVPIDITSQINIALRELNTFTDRIVDNTRCFISSTQVVSFTSQYNGLLKVRMHKKGSGNTARLKINNREIDQFSCYSDDSSGTQLPWIVNDGDGVDVILSAYVKKGDTVLIDSDQTGSPTTSFWYVYSWVIQYNQLTQ